jgi:hypothetical protein
MAPSNSHYNMRYPAAPHRRPALSRRDSRHGCMSLANNASLPLRRNACVSSGKERH